MLSIKPGDVPLIKFQSYLIGAVTPRPIAFVSSIDHEGNVNLSPFSYFNVFGVNPPILIFSPSRRVRNNTTKHTYENVLEVPEVVIHIVDHTMVQQSSVASIEFPKGVNEFVKAGFTEVPSEIVKPPRVGEAAVSMECKVVQVVPLGDQGGSGNLVICEVVMIHIKEEVLDAEGRIDPVKLDAVARLGGDWYCRVNANSIFKVPKPLDKVGIGVDQIPGHIRFSKILTGNDLGILANVEKLPEASLIEQFKQQAEVQKAIQEGDDSVHILAKEYLAQGKVQEAWKVLL